MKNISPLYLYNKDLQSNKILPDAIQKKAILELDKLCKKINTKYSLFFSIAVKLGIKKKSSMSRGIYLYGGVGRGKTYLISLFFQSLNSNKKLDIHYHRFMKMVHEQLESVKGVENPLKIIASFLASKYEVICFDEFVVEDIADAMLLSGLLEEMFSLDMVLLASSNSKPENLYKNGLQRSKFIPSIKLIEDNMQIIKVDSNCDYRLNLLNKSEVFFTNNRQDTRDSINESLENFFTKLSIGKVKNSSIMLNNRSLSIIKYSNGVAWFDFGVLCGDARSKLDYIEIAILFHTVIIENVSVMGSSTEDEAKRFITLIDELYAKKVNLIMSTEDGIDNLYSGDRLAFEFARTKSRLHEMRSIGYLSLEHLKDLD